MRTESTMCCRWVAYRMCMALCRMGITCMMPPEVVAVSLSVDADNVRRMSYISNLCHAREAPSDSCSSTKLNTLMKGLRFYTFRLLINSNTVLLEIQKCSK